MMLIARIKLFSQLNPDFYAYGTLPLYILKATVQVLTAITGKLYDSYDGALIVGRWLSSLADIGVAIGVFQLGKLIFKKNLTAWFSLLAYSLFFFAIQNSNFFIVDNYLNFFLVWSLTFLLRFYQQKQWQWLYASGLMLGLAAASKITALVVLPIFIVSPWVIERKISRIKFNFLMQFYVKVLAYVLLGFSIGMPYALINFSQFIKEIKQQLAMNSNAYVFPYTLQYVKTTPYLYYLKQIFLWGIGPIASLWTLVGAFSLNKKYLQQNREVLLVLIFYAIYFLIAGRSAVKFMRYMLPIYPLFALLIGRGFTWFLEKKKISISLRKSLVFTSVLAMTIWVLGFISIYFRPHSRVEASEWINSNIHQGSVLAIEHWDDRLPFMGQEKYQFEELPIYEQPDDQKKWTAINTQLDASDYLILASNRLWVPLPKLSECDGKPRCYPLTADYYSKLFSDSLSFKKVAEFSSYPSWPTPWGSIELNDDNADESFTVYDHPKVIIFKRTF